MAEKKLRIREVIVVEGRYDRNTLSQVVDALIFETNGFAVFNDREKLDALRMLAEERGLRRRRSSRPSCRPYRAGRNEKTDLQRKVCSVLRACGPKN